jgi:hypothetical protein
MFLLVDTVSLAKDPELPYLLSFGAVDDLQIEQHVVIKEQPKREPVAILGEAGTRLVSLAPLYDFRRFATDIASRPGCTFSATVIERAMAFSFLADLTHADAVVSPARAAFGPHDQGLLRTPTILTIPEALAMIGTFVRQRDKVWLGGSPLQSQERTEVYPLTARLIVPRGQEWWSSCVQLAGSQNRDLLGYAQAVFQRVGQALRGRDSVHESLRLGSGRGAILNALYHLDVVLTSSVGSLDALARVVHEVFGVPGSHTNAGWQRDSWLGRLEQIVPTVASAVKPGTCLGAALRVLTGARNSIHGIPLDEYLHVERTGHSSLVEHRVMLSSDLSSHLAHVGQPIAPLEREGLYLDTAAPQFLNVGEFTERMLFWTIELLGVLLQELLSLPQFPKGREPEFDDVEQLELIYCQALARIGSYPYLAGARGLAARSSLHQNVLAGLQKGRA